ncbi:MAG TPA: glycosyltransferase [Mucilaginibacter sp.]|jgi:glycosyltransferase involved in cell wall biosynthesis|nr:glycosyltransferase [Mucilaginibacter sp.]
MKILFILPEYYPHSGGGISTYYQQYIRALQPYCDEIKVIVGSGYVQSKDIFDHEGVIVEYLKPELYNYYLDKFTLYDLLPDFKRDLASAWAIWHQANQANGFDVVECTDFSLGFIPWVINHTKPVVTRLHGSTGQISLHELSLPADLTTTFYQQAELTLLPKCDLLISHSAANAEFWNQLIDNNKVIVSYPVYEHNNQPLPLPDREDHGLVTARIQRWKGPVTLCEVYNTLTIKPTIKWYGRDMLYTSQQSTSDYLKQQFPNVWGKYIIPHKDVTNTTISRFQQKAKFGIVPSTWDMFNFSVLEFMAAGTPVICSDGAGASELIEHRKNGFVYPAADQDALAGCINTLNNMSAVDYESMCNAATETIKQKLAAKIIIPANLLFYKDIICQFVASPSNHYFDSLYKPAEQHYNIAAVLNKQPLKKLTAYYIKRLKLKLLSKK